MDFAQLNLFALYILLFFTLVSMGIDFLRREKRNQHIASWFLDWLGGLSHEFAGALITGIVILALVAAPMDYFDKLEKVRDLARQARSSDPAISQLALETMRDNFWFQDGTLQQVNLSGVSLQNWHMSGIKLSGGNLSNAFLQGANFSSPADFQNATFSQTQMSGMNLFGVNLRGAVFHNANLQNSILRECDLRGAFFIDADLRNVDFEDANLQGAILKGANLVKTDLQGVNLAEADLTDVVLDESTLLPDLSHWNSQTDMSRFTNSAHPNFLATLKRTTPKVGNLR